MPAMLARDNVVGITADEIISLIRRLPLEDIRRIEKELQSIVAEESLPPPNDTITMLPEAGYHLRKSIPVTVRLDGSVYLVVDHLFHRYGVGDSVDDAKTDWAYALLDYFDTLEEHEAHLAPHLARDLARLREIIVKEQD